MQACQPLRELQVPTPLVIFACAVEIVAKATARVFLMSSNVTHTHTHLHIHVCVCELWPLFAERYVQPNILLFLV